MKFTNPGKITFWTSLFTFLSVDPFFPPTLVHSASKTSRLWPATHSLYLIVALFSLSTTGIYFFPSHLSPVSRQLVENVIVHFFREVYTTVFSVRSSFKTTQRKQTWKNTFYVRLEFKLWISTYGLWVGLSDSICLKTTWVYVITFCKHICKRHRIGRYLCRIFV